MLSKLLIALISNNVAPKKVGATYWVRANWAVLVVVLLTCDKYLTNLISRDKAR